jgi:cyclopropane fatty-acyl-phospholipid synthase-like methyltransferase
MYENSGKRRLSAKDSSRVHPEVELLLKNKKVLDVGCGTGWLTKYVSQKDYIGITYSETEIRNLQKKGYSGMKVILPGRIPVKDSAFEVVFASHLIEHFEKRELTDFMKEIKRVLKPNGILILITPTEYNPFFYGEWTHVRPYNHSSLPELLHDFEYEKIKWFYPMISWLPKKAQALLRFPFFFLKPFLWNEVIAYGYNIK